MDSAPIDPEATRALADTTDDAELAAFLRAVADDAEKMRAASTPVGAYARRAITAGPDADRVDRLADSIESVAADREFVDAVLSAKAEVRLHGVDWLDIARDMVDGPAKDAVLRASAGEVSGFLDAADPVLAALRHLEPPAKRPWRATARVAQIAIAESRCAINLFMGGRGTGKGFATSNALVEWALAEPGDYAAIAPTLGDARKIVTEGPSGLLVALGDDLSHYNKAEFILYLRNGSRIILAGAEKPDRIRGLNLRGALIDELASFGAKTLELWNEALMPALRIGRKPRVCIATTPRRGNPILKDILARHDKGDTDVLVVHGTTRENAENLSEAFIASIYKQYAGTRLAAQELEGLLLDEVDGALLSGEMVERNRIISADDVPPLHRIVVGVDPAVTSAATSDMTGIVVCGIGPAPRGWTPPPGLGILSDAWHLYILEDRSLRASPETWARRALTVAQEWAADCITAEVNQGGDLVSSQVRMVARASGLAVPRIHQVRASVGKAARAEPVAALFEQDRAHMVGGFAELEDEWCGWVPGSSARSPDRLDASVWAAVELFPELGIKPQQEVRVIC